MIYKIVETDLAEQDLDGILKYIVETLNNHTAAVSFFNAVKQCYESISQYPFMYALCQNPKLSLLGYHKVVIKHYVMIYKVDESSNTIYILRFFHCKQNYEVLL